MLQNLSVINFLYQKVSKISLKKSNEYFCCIFKCYFISSPLLRLKHSCFAERVQFSSEWDVLDNIRQCSTLDDMLGSYGSVYDSVIARIFFYQEVVLETEQCSGRCGLSLIQRRKIVVNRKQQTAC